MITLTAIFPGRCPRLASGAPLALEKQCRFSFHLSSQKLNRTWTYPLSMVSDKP